MIPTRHFRLYAALGIACTIAASIPARAQSTVWSSIETILGRKGAWNPDSVFKFSIPRVDLAISKDGIAIRPAFALTSWAAFTPAGAGNVMAMGDLVATEQDVAQVVLFLHDGGANPTAVHNHLIGETPKVMYVHFMATGDAVRLARAVKSALDAAGLPPADMPPRAGVFDIDTAAIARTLGRTGKVNGGVYQISVARADTVRMGGMVIPPAMGLATSINFQPSRGGDAAITGDFVLTEKEIAPVIQACGLGNIRITALHSHTTGEEPRLYFMHFWSTGNVTLLARSLHEALSHMNVR